MTAKMTQTESRAIAGAHNAASKELTAVKTWRQRMTAKMTLAERLRNESRIQRSELTHELMQQAADALDLAAKALGQGAAWLAEYAEMHRAKGADDKAQRNQERADYLATARAKLQPADEGK